MKNLLNLPNPQKVRNSLAKAIRDDTPAPQLLYQILTSGGYVSRGLNGAFTEYSEAWQLLTSEQGRRYIRRHLDAMLDYVAVLSKKK